MHELATKLKCGECISVPVDQILRWILPRDGDWDRYDIVVKYMCGVHLLDEQWSEDHDGVRLYLKMYQQIECRRADPIRQFCTLAESMKKRIKTRRYPLRISHNNVFHGGTHRLALAVAMGVPSWYVIKRSYRVKGLPLFFTRERTQDMFGEQDMELIDAAATRMFSRCSKCNTDSNPQ